MRRGMHAGRQHDPVEAGEQLAVVVADRTAEVDGHTEALKGEREVADRRIEVLLARHQPREAELAAQLVLGLEQLHPVAGLGERARRFEARGTSADDREGTRPSAGAAAGRAADARARVQPSG